MLDVSSDLGSQILIDVAEAARRLAIGRSHLYRFLESGELPSLLIGRCRRIRVADLDAFVRRLHEAALDSAVGY